MISLEQGIDVFCSGFSYTRSFTHPYEVHRSGEFWQMKDGPRKKGDRRASEVVTTCLDAARTLTYLHSLEADRLFLCVLYAVDHPEEPILRAYKELGCRLLRREPMMVRTLANLPELTGPFPIRRVTDSEDAGKVAKAARTKQILPKDVHDGDSDLRLFAAWNEENPVGWVRSVRTSPESTWVSNMYVNADYRRQGIGRSLMAAMLRDDQRHGYRQSVLLASQAGTLLYETLGYERIGTLLLLDPKSGTTSTSANFPQSA